MYLKSVVVNTLPVVDESNGPTVTGRTYLDNKRKRKTVNASLVKRYHAEPVTPIYEFNSCNWLKAKLIDGFYIKW